MAVEEGRTSSRCIACRNPGEPRSVNQTGFCPARNILLFSGWVMGRRGSVSDLDTLVLLEGNIAAGKSTLGHRLKASRMFEFIKEPVSAWRKGFASNLLSLFYSDPQRWSFTFQLAAFTTRAMAWASQLEKLNHRAVILERSIYCDRYVFAKNCFQRGLMTNTEWELYCHLWDWLKGAVWADPDVIIYLRTPAKTCLERIRERGRMEEASLNLSYLLDLEGLHDSWLLDNPDAIVLDGEETWTAEAIRDALCSHGIDLMNESISEGR